MKTRQTKHPLIFLWLYLSAIIGYGQDEDFRFEHITEQNGLSNNAITSIYQDSEGFMWIGTANGLNKYDGYNFTILRHDPNAPQHSLRHNQISDIHEDREGRLWVTTSGGGFHEVDKYTGKVTRYEIMPRSSFEWNYLMSIYEDQDENLWICGFGGLALFDREAEEFTLYPAPGEPTSGKAPAVFSIARDSANRIWAGTTSGLYQFHQATGEFTYVEMDSSIDPQDFWCNYLYLDKEEILWIGTDIGVHGRKGEGLFRMDTKEDLPSFTRFNPGGLISNKIYWNGIYEDDQGYMWVYGSEGLHRINKQTDQVLNFEYDPLKPTSLSHENVYAVYQDSEGTYWIGTAHGINKASTSTGMFQTYQRIPAHASDIHDENAVSALLEDHTGTIWLGYSGSAPHGNPRGSLFQFDPNTKTIESLSIKDKNAGDLADNQVLSFLEDSKKRLWVGTGTALNLLDRKTGDFRHYDCEIPIWNMDEGASGKIWIGGKTGMASFDPKNEKFIYYKYDPKDTTRLKHLFVFDILASYTGEIWAATEAGIARLNSDTDVFTHLLPSETPSPKHLNDISVMTLYEDQEGIVWIGTRMGGLNRFDPSSNTFTHFTTREGLPSNTIFSIVGDDKGALWLGTNKGISHFTPEDRSFQNFDVSDGLPSSFAGVGFFSSSGKLLFGTDNGFVIFNPDSIQDNTTVPPVYITGFQVMDEERAVPAEPIELAHDENFLSFDFVALNYDAPEKNQYAYMLEGVDKDWVYSDTRRFASYTNLDPGEYTFRVKASNNDGIWNEEGSFLHITILPPWWQTSWAYALYAILGLSFLYSLRQYTVKRERLKHELSIQRMEAEKMHEVDQLKSRFFANISHEFRTPLTLLLGPLDKLMAEPAYAQERSLFSMMQRNAQRLLHLINQLLDLSRLEAGRMKADVKAGAIVPFLKSIGLSFTPLAERQQISYHFQYPNDHPVVYFDADKLEKIITNLLSNAFKFTPTGGCITFSAQLHAAEKSITTPVQKPQDAADLSLLELKVEDSGVGMTEEQLAHVFHRFYQADDSQQGIEGSGIGLSLVRELVELYGGEVTATSKAGEGSCFTVKLPLWQASFAEIIVDQQTTANGKEQLLPSAASGYESNGKSIDEDTPPDGAAPEEAPLDGAPLILIVEDNADVRAFIRENLQAVYQLMEAADGVQGYQQATEQIPDLILSDVMMPKMDGVELCAKLKADEKTAHIPVILLTAKASGGDKIEGLKTGADDYIIKPFKADELLVRIKNLIESRKKLREQFSREITLQPRSVKVSSADERFLLRLMEIMEEHMADFTFGVEALGKALGMSRVQLYRKLKALTNQSPGDFIRMMRLKRAAELLAQDSGSIAEVAYAVGFNDPSYFSKSFHKQYGQTPSEYVAAAIS